MTARLLAIALCAIFATAAHAAELRVHAAASLSDTLSEIGKVWEKRGGAPLRLNFGGSNLLARQIEEGAPGDVFFSADEEKMNALDRQGLVVRETRRSFLGNSLVVIVPSDSGLSVRTARDLVSAGVQRIAVAEPTTVPAGIYARQWLEQLKLWSKLSRKLVTTENVRGVLLAVEGGNVDAGIVYRTDAMVSRKARVAFVVSGAEAPAISYPAAVLTEASNAAEARKFLAFLESDEAKVIFRRRGFVLR
jgi:molybdate transport system substrate-binding protein